MSEEASRLGQIKTATRLRKFQADKLRLQSSRADSLRRAAEKDLADDIQSLQAALCDYDAALSPGLTVDLEHQQHRLQALAAALAEIGKSRQRHGELLDEYLDMVRRLGQSDLGVRLLDNVYGQLKAETERCLRDKELVEILDAQIQGVRDGR